jgi:Plasmid pRiA4b ORF-3-like protein
MNHFLDPPHVYQLRIVLWGTSPLIWRRMLVHSDASLATLHKVLQILFAWSDEHLHCFHIQGNKYGNMRPEAVLLVAKSAAA